MPDTARNHLLLILFFLWLSQPLSAQSRLPSAVDKHAASVGYHTDLDILYSKLAVPTYSDSQKVRAFYYWITQHISYDIDDYHNDTYSYPFTAITDSAAARAFWSKHYVTYVLKNKKAVCEGYAVLFKQLCDKAGIPCIVIHGCGKSKTSEIGQPFDENHAWNAVKVNNKWRLMDLCWASGYCDDKVTKFTRQRNERYYMPPPELMIFNHYPSNPSWALLKMSPSKEAFMNFPILHDKGRTINLGTVNTGLLEANIGDTINIEIYLNSPVNEASDEEYAFIQEFDGVNKPVKTGKTLHFTFTSKGKKLLYRYFVTSKNVTTLSLSYNSENLAAYRLRVK